jgi:hypothetical protein
MKIVATKIGEVTKITLMRPYLETKRTQLALLLNTSHTSTMESSQNTLQSYALALLTLVGRQEGADGDNPPFGFAIRVRRVKGTTFYHQTAHSPQTSGEISLPTPSSTSTRSSDVYKELNKKGGNITPVAELANYYLTHLVIACRAQCTICWR